MKIESSTVTLASQASYKKLIKTEETLKVWGSPKGLKKIDGPSKDAIDLSDQAKNLVFTPPVKTIEASNSSLPSKNEQELTILQQMLEALTGKKIKFPPKLNLDLGGPDISQAIQRAVANRGTPSGFDYSKTTSHYEAESIAFEAQASVTTGDGRAINIDIQLKMSREFLAQSSLNIKVGQEPVQLIDPLVINFDSQTTSLTERKYHFDIDADGSLDQISFVGPGSGFLSLDLNNDGIINDGSELFGPQSGNGFADLAKYDLDGNMWIDENDAIYEKLQIWSKDEAGNDVLMALGQRGIGAIYLGNVSTPFAINGSNNQSHGQLQATGIFLNEDGTGGTVQHLDLTV